MSETFKDLELGARVAPAVRSYLLIAQKLDFALLAFRETGSAATQGQSVGAV